MMGEEGFGSLKIPVFSGAILIAGIVFLPPAIRKNPQFTAYAAELDCIELCFPPPTKPFRHILSRPFAGAALLHLAMFANLYYNRGNLNKLSYLMGLLALWAL